LQVLSKEATYTTIVIEGICFECLIVRLIHDQHRSDSLKNDFLFVVVLRNIGTSVNFYGLLN